MLMGIFNVKLVTLLKLIYTFNVTPIKNTNIFLSGATECKYMMQFDESARCNLMNLQFDESAVDEQQGSFQELVNEEQ